MNGITINYEEKAQLNKCGLSAKLPKRIGRGEGVKGFPGNGVSNKQVGKQKPVGGGCWVCRLPPILVVTELLCILCTVH